MWMKLFRNKNISLSFSSWMTYCSERGLSPAEAARLYAQHSGSIKASIASTMLQSGKSLSEVMPLMTQNNSKSYASAINAGEKYGCIQEVLRLVTDHEKHNENSRRSVREYIAYPAVLSFVVLIAMLFLRTFVMPSMMSMYQNTLLEFSDKLPQNFQLLPTLSHMIGSGFSSLLNIMIVVAVLYISISSLSGFPANILLDPGRKLKKLDDTAFVSKLVAILAKADTPLNVAFALASESATSSRIAEQCRATSETFASGKNPDETEIDYWPAGYTWSLSSISNEPDFPQRLTQLSDEFLSSSSSELSRRRRFLEAGLMMFTALAVFISIYETNAILINITSIMIFTAS